MCVLLENTLLSFRREVLGEERALRQAAQSEAALLKQELAALSAVF